MGRGVDKTAVKEIIRLYKKKLKYTKIYVDILF